MRDEYSNRIHPLMLSAVMIFIGIIIGQAFSSVPVKDNFNTYYKDCGITNIKMFINNISSSTNATFYNVKTFVSQFNNDTQITMFECEGQ